MFQIDCLRSQRQKFDAFPKVAITLHHQSTTTKFTTFHKKGSVLLVVSVNKKKDPIPVYPGIVKDATTSMGTVEALFHKIGWYLLTNSLNPFMLISVGYLKCSKDSCCGWHVHVAHAGTLF